jgi:hypothetical protein
MRQEKPPPPNPPSGIDRFAELIAGLIRTVWGRNLLAAPVLLPNIIRPILDAYIAGYARRFAAIAARWRAGTLRRPPIRAPRAPDAAPIYNQPPTPRPKYDPPHDFGWLAGTLKWQGCFFGNSLYDLIRTDPEIRALLEAAPQLTRVLRPLLRAFGHKPEPGLLPPLPPRRSRARPKPAQAAAKPPRPAKPGTRAYWGLRPQDSWMPHHPAQVRARLPGYRDVKLPKRS